jgi:ribosome-associated protein
VTRDDDRTARQVARSKTKRAGDRSAKIARTLMELKDHQLAKLDLDEDLRADVKRARAVTSHIARRRAERTLAGDLRKYEIGEVDEQLARLEEGGNSDARMLHLAEQWRARLIAEGMAAAADLPGAADDELPRLIAAAQRERDTGKPPGAARALFRYVVARLATPR